MGVRGEIFSNKVILPNRTYFFNVKENRMGDLYLNIVESKNRDSGGFERQSVILFADDLQEFLKGFDESLRVLEKAAREKRLPQRSSSYSGKKREDAGARDQNQAGNHRASRSAEAPREEDRSGYSREHIKKRAENRGGEFNRERSNGSKNIRPEKRGQYPRERTEGERGKRGGEFSRGRTDNSRNEPRGKNRQNFSGGKSSGETFRGNSSAATRGNSSAASRGNSSANRRKDRGDDYQPKNKKRVVVKKRD